MFAILHALLPYDANPGRMEFSERTPMPKEELGMVNKAIELAEAHGWFLTRQFENEANVDMHSRTTVREIVGEPRASGSITG